MSGQKMGSPQVRGVANDVGSDLEYTIHLGKEGNTSNEFAASKSAAPQLEKNEGIAPDTVGSMVNMSSDESSFEHQDSLDAKVHSGHDGREQHASSRIGPSVDAAEGKNVSQAHVPRQTASMEQEKQSPGSAIPFFGVNNTDGVPPNSQIYHNNSSWQSDCSVTDVIPPSPSTYSGNAFSHLSSPTTPTMAESSLAGPMSPVQYLAPPAHPAAQHGCGGLYQTQYGGGNESYQFPTTHSNSASPVPSTNQIGQHQKGLLQNHVHSSTQNHADFSSTVSQRSESFGEVLPPPVINIQASKQGSYFQRIEGQPLAMGLDAGNPNLSRPQHWGAYNHDGSYESWHGENGLRQGFYCYAGRYIEIEGQSAHAISTPGPPIQVSYSNKGPDGANLFIFHIPNQFTNLDMYNLFCHYGNLLSVRIMVEQDTGRSRGFGFVSYESPKSAAMAIRELNGYVIGNKRLKVQYKQARRGGQPTQARRSYHHTDREEASANVCDDPDGGSSKSPLGQLGSICKALPDVSEREG